MNRKPLTVAPVSYAWAVRLRRLGGTYWGWQKLHPQGFMTTLNCKRRPPLCFATATEAEIACAAYTNLNEDPYQATAVRVQHAVTHRLSNDAGFIAVPLEEAFALFAQPS